MDGARAKQNRLAPLAERGDVGGVSGYEGGEAAERAQLDEGNIENSVHLGEIADRSLQVSDQAIHRADHAIKQVCARKIRNDIGCASTFGNADVHGGAAAPGVRIHRELNLADALERVEEFFGSRFAEMRIRRMR